MKPPTRSGPVLADRVHRRGGDQLARLLPVAAHQPAAATLAAVARRPPRPAANAATGSGSARARRAPALEQAAADVRVAEPGRRVRVPGERRAARAPARLVVGPIRIGSRIVDRLALPGDQPVLDVDVPRARAGAVHAVRGAHDLVVAPAVAIGRLPAAAPGDQHAPALRAGLAPAEELVRGHQPRVRAHARSRSHGSARIVGIIARPSSRPTSARNLARNHGLTQPQVEKPGRGNTVAAQLTAPASR